MLVIGLLGFSIKQKIGDPVRDIVGVSVSVAERDALRDKLGLNDPFLTQYVRFIKTPSTAIWACHFSSKSQLLK